jgi:hypothetical protein
VTAARDLAPGQTITRSSFALDSPAKITSVEPSSLRGSATVVVHGEVNGEDREWIFYADEMVWTCRCTCGSQADPGCPEGNHCGGDQCVGPGDSFVDDD